MADGPTYVDIAGVVRPRYVTIGGVVRPIWVEENVPIWGNGKYIFSCKKVVPSYTGYCMQIQKSGGATQEVGFDSSGVRDASTISTYAAGTNTNINHFYDQLGSSVKLSNTIQVWYAYYNSAVTSDSNGNPSVYCPVGFYNRTLSTGGADVTTTSGVSVSFFGEFKAAYNARQTNYITGNGGALATYCGAGTYNELMTGSTSGTWQVSGSNYQFPFPAQPRPYAWTTGTGSSTTAHQFANGSVTSTTLSTAMSAWNNPSNVALCSHQSSRVGTIDCHVSELIVWETDLFGQTAAMISDTQSRYT